MPFDRIDMITGRTEGIVMIQVTLSKGRTAMLQKEDWKQWK